MHNRQLLSCGALAAGVYVATDVLASVLYPGYSFRNQAVSELFAIGAPTRTSVAMLFSVSSMLLLAFSLGVWRIAGTDRLIRALALAFAGSALVGLLLWIGFPMHMRGVERTFTDTMHLILASNPFVLATLVLTIASTRGPFRVYTLLTAGAMLGSAIPAFSYAQAVDSNLPTPWLGVAERLSQYAYALWQVVLALMLRHPVNRPEQPSSMHSGAP